MVIKKVQNKTFNKKELDNNAEQLELYMKKTRWRKRSVGYNKETIIKNLEIKIKNSNDLVKKINKDEKILVLFLVVEVTN